jgi:hypothetical protein
LRFKDELFGSYTSEHGQGTEITPFHFMRFDELYSTDKNAPRGLQEGSRLFVVAYGP